MSCDISGCNGRPLETTKIDWNGMLFIVSLCRKHADRIKELIED